MIIEPLAGCCGVKELTELRLLDDPLKNMQAFVASAYDKGGFNGRFRYGLFAEANLPNTRYPKTYGKDFAAFILSNELGEVIETRSNINPNSGNAVKVWLWTINHDAVRAWSVKNPTPVSVEKKQKLKDLGVPAAGAITGEPSNAEIARLERNIRNCVTVDCADCRRIAHQIAEIRARLTAATSQPCQTFTIQSDVIGNQSNGGL